MIQELQSGKSVLLEIWHIPKQLMANVLMFIPGGFLLAAVCPRIRHWKGIVICGAGCSAAIEIIQFFIGRIADIDDVLMNSLGAAIGFALFQWGWREIQNPDALAAGINKAKIESPFSGSCLQPGKDKKIRPIKHYGKLYTA